MSLEINKVMEIATQRATRWHNGDIHGWTVLEWAGAMCGEAGEAANVAKKIRRMQQGLVGNKAVSASGLKEHLASELAGTFLYLVLVAASEEIDLEAAIVWEFNSKSEEIGAPERLGV